MSRMMGTAARKVPLLLACLPKVPTFTEMSFAYWHFLKPHFLKSATFTFLQVRKKHSYSITILTHDLFKGNAAKIFWHKQQITSSIMKLIF